jgi:hypothetical protein
VDGIDIAGQNDARISTIASSDRADERAFSDSQKRFARSSTFAAFADLREGYGQIDES